ncbi:peptidyl-tRNA hydrolase ICT1, mitochondrial [Neolamprologus brichardi]|uniref:peptidyl-tRNA hydrolase ICT1, mitochondrial n=1 Tax=Neolamprologus brichardi TaxID=32507 RepID=UPI0003EC5DE2|nr:peptidyl-tRNA hydrolase ICT1, mitochondrial [Neolamprologus brichardi]
MAASIARRSYVFCRCVGINVIRQHVTLRNVVLRHTNNTFQSSVSYGTRESAGTQETQVHIPVERLTVSYSRSSGPGGQHVNKVSTKAEVRFHVQTAEWIPEDVRKKILEKNKTRITKAGELLVTSELSRSQQRNLSDCIQKISAIIAEASEKPHEPTAEDIALRAARLEKRNNERLRKKKIHSATKQNRRVDFD